MSTYIETMDGFDIYFTAEPEYERPRDHFDDTIEDEEFFEKIESGYYDWFCAKVSAHKDGIELGSAYLGCCCYENICDFYEKYHDDYFADMAHEAIDAAKERIERLLQSTKLEN